MVSSRKGLAYVFSALGDTRKNQKNSLVLIDGTALMFRSYYAMPSMLRPHPNSQTEDREVGAVVGFCNTLLSLLHPSPPDSTTIVLFDSPGPTFREPLFAEYKGNRGPPPDDLGHQFDLAMEACEAFGWGAYAAPGYEADDAIATMAKLANEKDQQRTIGVVASDKDFYQLITETCLVLCPTKKEIVTEEEVESKFGVPPRLMVDLQSLMGDSVDNIPGVPGIGPKIGAQLLRQFGSLEAVLDNAHLVKQTKRRENLLQHRDSALLARQLVTLHTKVPPTSFSPCLRNSEELEALLNMHTPMNLQAAHSFCQANHLWSVARSIDKKF